MKRERNVIKVQIKCSKCGHINQIENETPYLYYNINSRYCDVCKSKALDIERLY